jgi:hypothetical protein
MIVLRHSLQQVCIRDQIDQGAFIEVLEVDVDVPPIRDRRDVIHPEHPVERVGDVLHRVAPPSVAISIEARFEERLSATSGLVVVDAHPVDVGVVVVGVEGMGVDDPSFE